MIDDILISESDILPEVKIISHSTFKDHRGIIYSHYSDLAEREILGGARFNHSKIAVSERDVLRGIHGDFFTQKLVTCLFGEIYQVIVDCRDGRPSFGRWCAMKLVGEDNLSVLIPAGFGNAFLTMSERSVYSYKLLYEGKYQDHDMQFTYRWNDERFGIIWPTGDPILSERDQAG